MLEIISFVLLLIGAITFAYLLYLQRNVVRAKDLEIKKLHELKDAGVEEQQKLHREANAAYQQSLVAINDRDILVHLIQMIWESRDTTAAEVCVRNLIAPSVDGIHYTIAECYSNLNEDLGLEKKR